MELESLRLNFPTKLRTSSDQRTRNIERFGKFVSTMLWVGVFAMELECFTLECETINFQLKLDCISLDFKEQNRV